MLNVISGKIQGPRMTCICGGGGVGKTTWASQASYRGRKALLLPCEPGTNDIECDRLCEVCEDYTTLHKLLRLVHDEEHEYGVLVVDTIDALDHLLQVEVARQLGLQSCGEADYGKDYSRLSAEWHNVMNAFKAIRRNRDMSIVLVSHVSIRKFADPMGPSYDRYQIKLRPQDADFVFEQCDEVLFATTKTHVVETKEGFQRKGQAVAGERVLYCTDRGAARAKNRLGMPDEIPLSWEAYASYWPKS